MFDLFSFNTRSAAYTELMRMNETDSLPLQNTSLFFKALCPNDPKQNVAYRQRVMDLAYDHHRADEYRKLFYTLASRDILWYCNTFLYTHSPKDFSDEPIRPMATWHYQNRDLLKIQAAIGNHDITITKSRDMGATWIILIALEHRWHFKANQRFLIASEKEDLVEKKGDMRALFEKIDFLHKYQPKWLLPTGRELGDNDPSRTNKHLGNADNGSTIEGEATVRDFGRSDRLTAAAIDEYASIPFTEAMERATRDATNCRIRNSTPKPRNAEGASFFKFFDREFKRDPSNNNPRLITQHWTQHPLKSAGLYKLDESGIVIPLDPQTYDWRSDFPFTPQNKPRSPWYDEQCDRASSSVEIAQELDLDFYGLGRRAFEAELLRKLRLKTRPPSETFQVFLDENNQLLFVPNIDGNFRIWAPFPQQEPANSSYIFGEDIAAGTAGDFSSNSTIVIIDAALRQVVATYADNTIDPGRFAQLAHALGKRFYNAFHCPESNGSTGSQFLATLIPLTSNIIIRGQHEENQTVRKTKRFGIHNNDRGTLILSQLQVDLRANQLSIPDEYILNELEEYELADDAKFKHGGSTDADSAAHGDLAIATAGAALGLRERPADRPALLNAKPPLLGDSFDNTCAQSGELFFDCMAHRDKLRNKSADFDPWEP